MSILLRHELESLVRVSGPCASIYLSLNPTGREGMGDSLRLRKTVDEAERQLTERGFAEREIREILAPARKYEKTPGWERRGIHQAILLGPGTQKFLAIESLPDEETWGDDHFHVRPLLPTVVDSDRFHLLAISEQHPQLYRGDCRELTPVEVPGLPRNIDDALQIEDVDRGVQTHSANAGGRGRAGAVFHGHGGVADAAKTMLKEYVQRIAPVVESFLARERDPLVLACVGEIVPLWRDASRFPHLCPEFAAGSPDHLSQHELHERSWAIVKAQCLQRDERLRERVRESRGTPRSVLSIPLIVPAAVDGRVDTLLVPVAKPIFGRFDRQVKERATVRETPIDGDCDLLELAIHETIRNRGTVLPFNEANDLSPPVEALLRY